MPLEKIVSPFPPGNPEPEQQPWRVEIKKEVEDVGSALGNVKKDLHGRSC